MDSTDYPSPQIDSVPYNRKTNKISERRISLLDQQTYAAFSVLKHWHKIESVFLNMDYDMTSHINDREATTSPISMKLESLLLEEIEKLKGIEDDTISKTTDHIPPVLTPIEPVQTYQTEVVEIYDDDEDRGNNQQNNSSTALVHRNYSQSQDNGTMKQSSRNQISERRNGSLLLRIQNDLGGDNLRQHLNDYKLKQVKAMELKGLDFLQKTSKLVELEKQQRIDSFKLKHIEGIMRQQEALQKQLKPETKKTKLPEYLVESWGHYAIIQSNRKMSRSGRLPSIPYQKLPLAEYLINKKNVRPTYLFLKDRQKNNRNLLGKNQPEIQSQQQQQQQQQIQHEPRKTQQHHDQYQQRSQQQQQQQQQQIQHEPRKTQQHHDQYQQRSQQPQQQQQQHYQTHQQQHNGDHYRSPNKYSTNSYHNINQNSHYNNSHYQYTSPSKSSDTMTTTTQQLHYSNEAEDPYAPTPIQYGQQNVYSYSNSNYSHSNTSNTASHGWNNSTYQTNTNIQPSQQSYNYSQYQTVAPNNAQTQNQSYVNQTSQSWVSYRTQEANRQLELQRNAERQRQMAEQQRRMEEQKRQQEAKRLLEEDRRRREQSRLQEQQAKFQQRRMRELRLQQEQLLEERFLLEQKKQQRLLQQKTQLHQVSNNNIDPIPKKSSEKVATKPLTKPHDEMFQKSSPLISKNGNNKHNSDLDKQAPKKGKFLFLSFQVGFEYFKTYTYSCILQIDTVILALKTDGFSNEEIESMPVVFAFFVDDANSISKATERQTKWNGRLRQKRIIKTTSTKKVKFSNKSGPQLVSEGPAGPDFPNGWTTKTFRRMSGKSKGQTDQYWFSAKTQKKMRSKVEINRFLSYLKSSNGDEEKAFALLKRK